MGRGFLATTIRWPVIGAVVTLGLLVAAVVSAAQPTAKLYRIGWLSAGSRTAAVDARRTFVEALHNLGYEEGRTVVLEERFAEGRPDRLRELVAELVGLKVDVLVTQGTPAGLAAKHATASIPIVVVGPGDPVGAGLVESLARPGGNVTGVSAAYRDIAAKCVELLREIVPSISRIGFLGNADNPVNKANFAHAQSAARTLGMAMEYFSATKPEEVGRALAALGNARVQGVVVTGDVVVMSRQREVVDAMSRVRLPAVYFVDDSVDIGGLMSYGPSRRDLFRHAAVYVDKILKGARPAQLPVEQPMKYALAINLKTAQALGLKIPGAVLLRADRVIE